MTGEHESRDTGLPRTAKLALVLFAIIVAFFLFAEHRAHVLPYLPWLLLAACPLMHLFMHHGTHRDRGDDAARARDGRRGGEGHHG